MQINYDLPDDPIAAFLQLESAFHEELKLQESITYADDKRRDYMVKVISAAEEYDIDEIKSFADPSFDGEMFSQEFYEFQNKLNRAKVRFNIKLGKAKSKTRLKLTSDQKSSLHQYLERIRAEVDASSAPEDKKTRIFKILNKLSNEIDTDSVPLQRIDELARKLAGISKHLADEGAMPWARIAFKILGIADEADEEMQRLPKPEQQKQLPAPEKNPDN